MPRVSIILPTYNRAAFLPDALRSIESQTYSDWELIVVDDGSTDESAIVIAACQSRLRQTVLYIHQENLGAYGARNTGLDHASGAYVAFFDSDDLWLAHHLQRCVEALDRQPAVDWVFAPCRMVDSATGTVLAPSTFHVGNRPRPLLALKAIADGDLRILTDDRVLECQVTSGLYAGLQNSVIRRRVFEGRRFWEDYRVVEDVLFLIRAIARGVTLAYLPDVNVIYRVHDDNSSASAAGATAGRLIPVFEEHARGFERLLSEVPLPPRVATLLRHQLGSIYFWRLGYAGYWASGETSLALESFAKGLRLRPLSPAMWKAYAVCWLRSLGTRESSHHA